MSMRRIIIIAAALLLFGGKAWTAGKETSFRWAASLYGGLSNNDSWEAEAAISYRPVKWAGVGAGMVLMGLYDGKESFMGHSTDDLFLYDVSHITRVLGLRGELKFTSPAIALQHDGASTLALRVSPGLTLALPVNNEVKAVYFPNHAGTYDDRDRAFFRNHGGDALYLQCKAQVVLTLERWEIAAGYAFSNFDIYGGARNVEIDGKKLSLPERVNSHFINLSLSYCF